MLDDQYQQIVKTDMAVRLTVIMLYFAPSSYIKLNINQLPKKEWDVGLRRAECMRAESLVLTLRRKLSIPVSKNP